MNVVSLDPSLQEPAHPQPSITRKFSTSGILWLLNRIVVYTLYLPFVLVARLFLNSARMHGEARSISVTQNAIELPLLPAAFDGLTIAFLTDLHCSALTPVSFLEQVVHETNRLKPDVILLGGDYVTEGTEYIRPVEQVLARLQAPLGVYGVLGNHDFDADADEVRAALARAGVVELTNRGCWLVRGSSRIRVAGMGDWWADTQDLSAALAGSGTHDTVILLSHNPDYCMEINDPRVSLVLSGHTHGGQIQLPRVGPLVSNSRYGKRLIEGLVTLPLFPLYVSRGIGTVMLPFRYLCPPEITLLTLCRRQASAD